MPLAPRQRSPATFLHKSIYFDILLNIAQI